MISDSKKRKRRTQPRNKYTGSKLETLFEDLSLKNAYDEIQQIDSKIPEYPIRVWAVLFGRRFKPYVSGDQVVLGPESDHANLSEAQYAAEYLVNQLGGKVKWDK